MQIQICTLTGYGFPVLVVLVILNGTAWFVAAPRRHGLGVLSSGFTLGTPRDVHRGSPLWIQPQLHFARSHNGILVNHALLFGIAAASA
jgi:hypothetical protein